MEENSEPQILVADMCQMHQWLLVTQAGYSKDDPWRALIIISQIALFQAATCDDKTHERLEGDLGRIGEIGCLACYKPDAFGEVVEAAKSCEVGAIKRLGERWIREATKCQNLPN